MCPSLALEHVNTHARARARAHTHTHTCIHTCTKAHIYINLLIAFPVSLFLSVAFLLSLSFSLLANPDDFVTISRGNGDRVCAGRIGIFNSQPQADLVIMCTQSAGQLISTFLKWPMYSCVVLGRCTWFWTCVCGDIHAVACQVLVFVAYSRQVYIMLQW